MKNKFISDTEIIRLFLLRDEKALDLMDRKYRRELLGVAGKILGNREDAEEILQDTYLKTWNSIPPNRPEYLLSYLMKILKNQAVSLIRKRNAGKRVPEGNIVSMEELNDLPSLKDQVEISAEYNEIRWIIDQYLEQVTDEIRYVFISVFVFDKSQRETAKEMHLSRYQVEKDLTVIRDELGKLLKERGYEC